MKKVLFAVSVLALCSCGKSNEDKAKELIEANLKTSMKDWSSYEFVEMSKLDSTFTTYLSTPEYDSLSKSISDLETKKMNLEIHSDYPELYGKTRCKEMTDSIPVVEKLISDAKNKIETGKKRFKREFNGWNTLFTYRGNNSFGAKIIGKTRFFFDKEVTEIVHTRDVSE